jgi:hypothetical protein
MRKPLFVFTCLWFGIYILSVQMPLEKYKIVSWKNKTFEDHAVLLVSFRLCFLIAEHSSSIFTIYYLL